MKITSITEITAPPAFPEVTCWFNSNMSNDVIDFDDQKVYSNVYHQATKRTPGVFQLTSGGAQRLFKVAKPKSLVDIATLTSIYRPGPLAAKVDKLYLEARANPEAIDYKHPLIKQVLEPTFGCLRGDTLITTESGEHTIKEIVEKQMLGLKLPSLNEASGEMEEDTIVAAIHTGFKETIEIEIEDGRTLHLTPDHRVYTTRGWIEAGSLGLEDEILGIE